MSTQEITKIGNALSRRRLKSKLWNILKIERPTLAWDTMWRAFSEKHCTDSDLYVWIQEEGKKLIDADDARIEEERRRLEEKQVPALEAA